MIGLLETLFQLTEPALPVILIGQVPLVPVPVNGA
jgi:hypothetical protein